MGMQLVDDVIATSAASRCSYADHGEPNGVSLTRPSWAVEFPLRADGGIFVVDEGVPATRVTKVLNIAESGSRH